MTYEDMDSATSSPASEGGATPCGLQNGLMTDLFGQALAPASRSAPRANSVAATMSVTYGLRSSTSSKSAALQASLASRLLALLDSRGSTMFALTWKAQATPLRRPICALRALAHPTSASGSTGWPTPMAGTPAQKGYNAAGNTDSSRRTVELASWPTCQSRDGANSRSGMPERTGGRRRNLDDYVTLAAWATPATRDYKSNEGSQQFHAARAAQARGKPLSEQTHSLLGLASHGSSAATAKPGQLNPAFSRWLMGYPKAWCEAAIDAWHQMPTNRQKGE